ncbi:hypothetical protein LOTGIDRAFT_172050 [Lottia gigantea]|uniref:Uncharacterized protein n=1 Tax=Lottia gigantea TaxID=225164 RepID=V4B4J2_LOTGI|nr:hypothetical protein LOTGIDRAFT_172050 [Lottia gigantea]ESP02391.1 hypothetical protein LOTGIDRAFT_172050 [Lottia gigantea]
MPGSEVVPVEILAENFYKLQLELRAQSLPNYLRPFSGEGNHKFSDWIRDLERRLPETHISHYTTDQSQLHRLVGVTGNPLNVHGKAVITFKLAKRSIQFAFNIVDRLGKNLIIGSDFFKSFGSDNRNICEAYSSFVDIIEIELKQRVPQLKTSSCSSRKGKSLHKPHWNDELSKLWKSVCDKEKAWIKCNEHCSKRKLHKEFCDVRDIFDKTNRRFKRLHQSHEQDRLLNLYESANKQDFWKQFGKIGIANDRKSSIPMKEETDSGFSSDPGDVLQRWKHTFIIY